MSDKGSHITRQQPDWEQARLVWATGGMKLPGTPGENDFCLLVDLKAAAGSYRSAKEITDADRTREWTPDQVADQCEALARVFHQLDDAIFARITATDLINRDGS